MPLIQIVTSWALFESFNIDRSTKFHSFKMLGIVNRYLTEIDNFEVEFRGVLRYTHTYVIATRWWYVIISFFSRSRKSIRRWRWPPAIWSLDLYPFRLYNKFEMGFFAACICFSNIVKNLKNSLDLFEVESFGEIGSGEKGIYGTNKCKVVVAAIVSLGY